MSTKAHDELRSMLSFYLVDGLGPAEEAEVGAHLEACGGCRAALDELAPVVELLLRHRPPERQPGGGDGSGEQARPRARRRAGWAVAGVAGLAATAAGLVLAFGGGPGWPVRLLYPAAGRVGAGSVALAGRPWGTQLTLHLEDLPRAPAYVAWVTGPHGRVAIGGWGPTPTRSAVVELATAVQRPQLRQIVVTTADGAVVLTSSPSGRS